MAEGQSTKMIVAAGAAAGAAVGLYLLGRTMWNEDESDASCLVEEELRKQEEDQARQEKERLEELKRLSEEEDRMLEEELLHMKTPPSSRSQRRRAVEASELKEEEQLLEEELRKIRTPSPSNCLSKSS